MAFKSPTTLAGWIALGPTSGLAFANNIPASYYNTALTVAQRHIPAGFSNPSGWTILCQAYIVVRGIIYFKDAPGDCGQGVPLELGSISDTTAAVNGIASMAGAALPGIGQAVSQITALFTQAHAAAVVDEQTVICGVAGIINQVIPYYDNLVRTGKISPSDAYAGMQAYIAQVTSQLSTIQKTCDAACVYSAVLAAHADFVQTYYPSIAPVQASASAPGAAPVAIGTTPGGVMQVGTSSGGGLTAQPINPVNQPANPEGVAGPSSNETWLIIAAIVGIILIFWGLV
jgi:hypothetical protein